jgi:hypothetical protein
MFFSISLRGLKIDFIGKAGDRRTYNQNKHLKWQIHKQEIPI